MNGCVNKNKEFYSLAKEHGIDGGELELIIHKYWNEGGKVDSFPSTLYISEQLGIGKTYYESGENVRKLWEKDYSEPIIVNSESELSASVAKAKTFFPADAITTYKDNKGNFVLRIAEPVTSSSIDKEIQDILAKAPRDSQGRLLAPNGKVSNLTEKQYAQVRTKAFKNWFGDWERVANNSLGNLKGNNDVSEIINNDGTINFDKLEEITNKYFKNVDSSLFKKGRKTLRERQEKHFDVNGTPIEANTLEHLINVTKSASEIEIKEELKPILVLAAALHDIAKPFHGGQRHGFQSVDVINSIFKGNISPLVKFAVRHHMLTLEESKEFTIDDAKRIIQDAIDNNLNVQDAIDILLALNTSDIMIGQKPSDIDRYSGKTKKETIEKEIPIKRKLLELAAKNSSNNASKVVDENGEPLVVYHGTSRRLNNNSFNSGFIFASNNDIISAGYGFQRKGFSVGIDYALSNFAGKDINSFRNYIENLIKELETEIELGEDMPFYQEGDLEKNKNLMKDNMLKLELKNLKIGLVIGKMTQRMLLK